MLTLVLGLIGGIALGNSREPAPTKPASRGTPDDVRAARPALPEPPVQLKPPDNAGAPAAAKPRKGAAVSKNATCFPPVPLDAVGWDGKGADRGDHIHQGYDLLAPLATPVYAVRDGVVIQSGFNGPSAGTLMKINHGNGLVTWYLHMVPYSWDSGDINLSVGSKVKKGQQIGLVGEEGYTVYTHLHIEVHRSPGRAKGTVLDPVKWLHDCGVTYYRDPRHDGT